MWRIRFACPSTAATRAPRESSGWPHFLGPAGRVFLFLSDQINLPCLLRERCYISLKRFIKSPRRADLTRRAATASASLPDLFRQSDVINTDVTYKKIRGLFSPPLSSHMWALHLLSGVHVGCDRVGNVARVLRGDWKHLGEDGATAGLTADQMDMKGAPCQYQRLEDLCSPQCRNDEVVGGVSQGKCC